MAGKKSRYQEKMVQKIQKELLSVYLFLGIALIAAIFILASAEHPKHWDEKDIVVSQVSKEKKFRGSYIQITDDTGAVYSIHGSGQNALTLESGAHYHIIHAHIFQNQIKYMADDNTVYVNYQDSILDYHVRAVLGWGIVLFCAGAALITTGNARSKIQRLSGR